IGDYQTLLDTNGIPASLEEAIHVFIAGCIIRRSRGDVNAKHSMMIHPDKKIINQDVVFSKIENYMGQVKYDVENNNQSGKIFVNEVKTEFLNISPRSSFDENEVKTVLSALKLHLVNGESAAKDLKKAMKLLPYHIVVGGDMLNRGLTIDGLAVSYILRVAKTPQMDTMLQRARWFGYKKQYLDTCMVYMPTVLKDQYEDLIESEEAIWEFLYACNDNNLVPKNMVPYLPAPAGGNLTAPQKAAVTLTNYASTSANQSYVPQNPQWNADNLKLVNSLTWNTSVDWATVDTHNNYSLFRLYRNINSQARRNFSIRHTFHK
ncbi:MAG: Z1 domain-containing protein, partial [Prevotellaceae bacterium]|nr:Z1 domain-containing protein [Prevotellaceae bacterium]